MKLKSFKQHFGGLNWKYTHKGNELSIICHTGSYGWESGLFEIQPSWRRPTKYGSVKGYLTFGEVQKWVNELNNLKNKKPKLKKVSR